MPRRSKKGGTGQGSGRDRRAPIPGRAIGERSIPGRAPAERSTAAGAEDSPATSPWLGERARFVLGFSLVAGLLFALYYYPRSPADPLERWTADYLRLYTRAASWSIGLFDAQVSAHGNLIAGRFSMQIVKSCDAMEANILFVAALLAVSAPWRRKLVALVAGLGALVVLNLVRLFVLYWVGVFAPTAFEFLHLDVWPLLMIVLATADFYLCVRWARASDDVPGAGDVAHGQAAV
jgi:exosortase/archaeosortase family protein